MNQAWLTVGVVTPHAAPGPEVELPLMTGGRVTTLVHRTQEPPDSSRPPVGRPASSLAGLQASTSPAAEDGAVAAFSAASVGAVVHASTTTGYLIGHREEIRLINRLSWRFDVPAVASCAAGVAALRAHGIATVQLVHPPWFDSEFDELGAAYFRRQGIDAVVTTAVGVPNDPARVTPHHVTRWVERHVDDRAQAIFLAGNGFRAAGAVQPLEQSTGRLVITANQVLLWAVLAATGTAWTITGYGRLLQTSAATA